MNADQQRTDRYADAIDYPLAEYPEHNRTDEHDELKARITAAVMAVADAEQEELRAIVKAQGQNVSPMAYKDAMRRGDALSRRALAAEARLAELRRILMQGGQDASSVRRQAIAALDGDA